MRICKSTQEKWMMWNELHVSRACSQSEIWFCVWFISAFRFTKIYFTETLFTCAAILSKSRRPWEDNRRPPFGSFSTNFNCSRVWRAFLAIVPEPALQWLGADPLLRRTEIKWIQIYSKFVVKNRPFFISFLTSVNLANGGNTNRRSDVNVSCHGSKSCVVPIFIKRSKLFGNVGFYKIYPFGEFDFTRPNEKIS